MKSLHSSSGGQKESIGDILLGHGVITQEQLSQIQETAKKRSVSIEDVLREEEIVADELLERAIAEYDNAPDVEQENENTQPTSWAEREQRKRERQEERQRLKSGQTQEKAERKIQKTFRVSNIFGRKTEKKKREPGKGNKQWGNWLASSAFPKNQNPKKEQKLKMVIPKTKTRRHFSIGKLFGALEPSDKEKGAETRVEKLRRLEQKQSARLQQLAERQANRRESLEEKLGKRHKRLEEKQIKKQTTLKMREEHRRMRAEIQQKKWEAREARRESARRAREEQLKIRAEAQEERNALRSAKRKEHVNRLQERWQKMHEQWQEKWGAMRKAHVKHSAERQKKRGKAAAERRIRHEAARAKREERRKIHEEVQRKNTKERQERQKISTQIREDKKKKKAEEKLKSVEAKRIVEEERQKEKERTAEIQEEKMKKEAEENLKSAEEKREKEEKKQREKEDSARIIKEEKEKKAEEKLEREEEERRRGEERQAKKDALREEREQIYARTKQEKKKELEEKWLAKASAKEEEIKETKPTLGGLFSHKKVEDSQQSKAETQRQDLLEETKQEALRQVLIEQQKQKLQEEHKKLQIELQTPVAGEGKGQSEKADPEEAKTPIQTSPDQSKEREEIARERDRLAKERTQFAEERDKLLEEATKQAMQEVEKKYKMDLKVTEKGVVTPEDLKAIEEAQKKLQEEQTILEEERKKLEEEQKKFEKEKATPESSGQGAQEAIEEAKKKLSQERAAFEGEKAIIMDKARKEAHVEMEKERTQLEIDKERMKQQALAEARMEALTTTKGKGLFGLKQRKTLQTEIEKWKVEAGKLEKERLELENMRALQEEGGKMREQRHQIEEKKIQLERDRISQEMTEIELEDAYKERVTEEKKRLSEDQQKLEDVKRDKKEGKRKKEKPSKKKKGKEEEIVVLEEEKIDIGKILMEQNYIEKSELEAAQKKAEGRRVSVEHILKEEGLVTKQLILNAIAEYYQIPFIDLGAQPPDTSVVELLPEKIAVSLHAIAMYKNEDGSITVATSNPGKKDEIMETIKRVITDAPEISMVFAAKESIESAFSFYRKPLNTRFRKIIEEHKKIAPEIIEELFADAIQLGASDIHFEPQENVVVVRFRVDGVMHEAGRIPKEYYEGIVNRIKIAGNMRIDEHFAAQDGAIRWKGGGRAMDVRVSIVPIVDGEKIVMRLLSEYVRTLTLTDLGFSQKLLTKIVKTAHKPFGMILATGPTGSGKSTTLYGLLKIRNSPDINISTIEDPVEYKIPSINHIQVNPKSGLTFERGLRALVRQDPDIILVGEIRDNITAQISVNAALTGHLLFSTLHANDASTAIPRLLEMGIEPFLLASTLELIIAQRLIRRICNHCRFSYNISHEDACQLFSGAENYFEKEKKEVTLYKGKGCKTCGETGYKGRVGVYELLDITTEIEELIIKQRPSGEIDALARSQGMHTLFEDGLEKVQSGLTTIEELLRIATPPENNASFTETSTNKSR